MSLDKYSMKNVISSTGKTIEELKDQLEYAEDIVETIRESLIILDTNLRIISANTAFYKTFKVTKGETVGQYVYALGHGQWDIPELRQLLEDILPKKSVFNDFEVSHTFPTIGQKVMLLNARRIDHKQLILLAIQDITQQRTLQVQEKEVITAAKIIEEKFNKLFEKSDDVISIIDEHGGRVFSTPSVKTVLGYDANEHLGPEGLTKVHPNDLPNSLRLLAEVKKNPGKSISYIQRIQHKNGSWIWVEGTATNLLHEPSVRGIVLNYRDVTERIKNEQRKDDFIAMASHELKTPLTSAKVLTQVLQKRFKELQDKESQRIVTKVNGSLDKLGELVRSLLDVTNIQQGKLAMKQEEFLVKELVTDIIDDLQPITKHHLSLDWHTKLYVRADKERIRQVLVNLITNAIKYSPNADEVTISSSKQKKFLVVSVQDFGIGIPQEEQKKIFDRFYQANGSNTYPGLGLGLYISNEIIKQNGGEMWVTSEEGKGSTFYFKLPIIKKGSIEK